MPDCAISQLCKSDGKVKFRRLGGEELSKVQKFDPSVILVRFNA